MDNLVAIGVGLGLRALIDTVTHHNHRVNGSLVGLWEGAVLRHFISKYPASVDPYVSFGFRLLVDLLWTMSWTRLFITILWSFMGLLLSDFFVDLYADRRFRRFMRKVRHAVIYPLLRLFSRSSGRRRSSGVGTGSGTPSRAQFFQIPASSSATSTARSPTSLRSPPLQPRSPPEQSRGPFRPTASSAAGTPRRPALRVPGSFSDRYSETDTDASRPSTTGSRTTPPSVSFSLNGSRTPSVTSWQEPARPATQELPLPLSRENTRTPVPVPNPSRTPVPEPSRTPVPEPSRTPSRTPVLGSSRPPTREPSVGPPPRPRTPSELEYGPIPVIPDTVERARPIRPVLSDDERSMDENIRSGLTTPERDGDRPRIDVYSPEPADVNSGLTTPERPFIPLGSLPPVTVLDEAGTQASGGNSDVNPVPIPIRVYERTPDADDRAQTQAALLHPELIPDINTPQPSPGLAPPAEYLLDMNPSPTTPQRSTKMPEPELRSDVARTSLTEPPPAYEPTPGETAAARGEAGEGDERNSDGTPAGSVISNAHDRSRLLQRAESLRSIADEADKRRTELGRALQDARRNRDFWAAFRLKHEMDRAAHDARELHAKAARRFYQAHNMKPVPQTIDVHRLKVPEAIEKVEEALYDSIVTGTPELRIITGQGKHSKNKIPALKLAIIGAMADYHIDAIPDETNPGVLLIRPPANPNFRDGPSGS
ncbi:hypothetical protein BD413DRAFT_531378 [Trametes elegans]|nr:hypothetical protein BD413DRAFT_531378 [Trametes elegans]